MAKHLAKYFLERLAQKPFTDRHEEGQVLLSAFAKVK